MLVVISEFLLLEDSNHLLLEDSGHIVLSSQVSASPYPILDVPKEDKILNVLKQGKSLHIPKRVG